MTPTGNLAALAEYEPRQLISDLFHQLSQPLTTLRCSLELALLQTLTTEQYREAVGQALSQAEKASWSATAIRELLDAGQVGPDLEVLELRRRLRTRSAICCRWRSRQEFGLAICPAPRVRCGSTRSGCARDYFICWDLWLVR